MKLFDNSTTGSDNNLGMQIFQGAAISALVIGLGCSLCGCLGIAAWAYCKPAIKELYNAQRSLIRSARIAPAPVAPAVPVIITPPVDPISHAIAPPEPRETTGEMTL